MREVFASVDEVGRVAEVESIDCGFQKGGAVYLARNKPQAKRQAELVQHEHGLGFTPDEIRSLSATEATDMVGATDVLRGIHFAPCAALNPAVLVRSLARIVEARGVKIFEQTAVSDFSAGRVDTAHGVVRADAIIQATEGYGRDLPGQRRSMVPLYSLMVATEPLPETVFEEIGPVSYTHLTLPTICSV